MTDTAPIDEAWRRLDPRMLVVGPGQEPDAAASVPARRAAHRPLRQPHPGLVRGRRRRRRRARRGAPLADHPLPDHRRAGRAAHRLAAPGAALGAARPDPHRRPQRLAAAPDLRPERRAGRVGDGSVVGSGPFGPHGSRRRHHGGGRTAAASAARPHLRRRHAVGTTVRGDRPARLGLAAVRPVDVLGARRRRRSRRSGVQPAGRGRCGPARRRCRRRRGAQRRHGTALGRDRPGRRGAARRRRRRRGRAVRRTLVRLPAHPRARRIAAGAARPAHEAVALGVARAAPRSRDHRTAVAAGRSRRAGPRSVDRPSGGRERCPRSPGSPCGGTPGGRSRPARRSRRGHPGPAPSPSAGRTPPSAHPRGSAGGGARGLRLARRSVVGRGRGHVAGAAPGGASGWPSTATAGSGTR